MEKVKYVFNTSKCIRNWFVAYMYCTYITDPIIHKA